MGPQAAPIQLGPKRWARRVFRAESGGSQHTDGDSSNEQPCLLASVLKDLFVTTPVAESSWGGAIARAVVAVAMAAALAFKRWQLLLRYRCQSQIRIPGKGALEQLDDSLLQYQ